MDNVYTYIRFNEKQVIKKIIYLIKTNLINISSTNQIIQLLLVKEVQPFYNQIFFLLPLKCRCMFR